MHTCLSVYLIYNIFNEMIQYLLSLNCLMSVYLIYNMFNEMIQYVLSLNCLMKLFISLNVSNSVMSSSFQPQGLQPARFLCPWNSPGKNTEVGCHFLLQRIFLTQVSSQDLLHLQADSLPSKPPEKPELSILLLLQSFLLLFSFTCIIVISCAF